MNRIFPLLLSLLLLLGLPFAALAENSQEPLSLPYSIEEGALTISVPSDFTVVQRGFDLSSAEVSSFKRIGLDVESLTAFFEESPVYLLGYSLFRSTELNIMVIDSRTASLKDADMDAFKADYLASMSDPEMNFDNVEVEFFEHAQTPFLETTLTQGSGFFKQYTVQYYTILNNKSIFINFIADSSNDLSFTRSVIDSISFGIDSRPTSIITALNPSSSGNVSADDLLLIVFAVYLLVSVSFAIIRRRTMTENAAYLTLFLILCTFLVIYTFISLTMHGTFVLRFEYLVVPMLLNIALSKLMRKKEEVKPVDTDELIP